MKHMDCSVVAPAYPGRSEDAGISLVKTIPTCRFHLKKGLPILQPMLGATSLLINSSKWYKDVGRLGVDAIEINRRHSKLYFSAYFIEKVKQYLREISVSVHSATTGIFQELESFTQAELATLQAEIDLAGLLDAHEVIFHLNGGALINSKERERLLKVIEYAKERNVDLIYESDSVLMAETTYRVLETLTDVGYALDLGHLNNGFCRNVLGCSIDEFVSRVRDRVVYIHANNNCGTVDEHKGLNDGSLDWRRVLGLLDLQKVRKIIIEVRSPEYLNESEHELKMFLAGRACATT